MGKIIITLTTETEQMLREFLKDKYRGKRGAMSIIMEQALREYIRRELAE